MGEEEDGDESGSPAPCRRRQSQQRAPVGLIGEQVWLRQSLGGKTLRPREPGRGPGDSQMERQLLPGASRAEPASCRGLSPGLPPPPRRPGPACLQSGGVICPSGVQPCPCCAAHTRSCQAGGERGSSGSVGCPGPSPQPLSLPHACLPVAQPSLIREAPTRLTAVAQLGSSQRPVLAGVY